MAPISDIYVTPRQRPDILESAKVVDTLGQLVLRITERFPQSSLSGIARNLHAIAQETDRTIEWIEKPDYLYRGLGFAFIALVLTVLAYAVSELNWAGNLGIRDFLGLSETIVNELILIGAAVIFIVGIDIRRKRQRIISALSKLRSIAHVIDAHQLAKDPNSLAGASTSTEHSPARELTPYLLKRYLDYCSELLALTSKVAFLYVQRFDDPVSVNAVYELENLTTGLSRKIWQKIMVLETVTAAGPTTLVGAQVNSG